MRDDEDSFPEEILQVEGEIYTVVGKLYQEEGMDHEPIVRWCLEPVNRPKGRPVELQCKQLMSCALMLRSCKAKTFSIRRRILRGSERDGIGARPRSRFGAGGLRHQTTFA